MFAPSLEALFLMLRAAGIPVGIEEVVRLAAVFALTPVLDREGLRRVLRSTLITAIEQRSEFDHTFDRWLTTLDGELCRIEPLIEADEPARPGTADTSGRYPAEQAAELGAPDTAAAVRADIAQQAAASAGTGYGTGADDDLFGVAGDRPPAPAVADGKPDMTALLRAAEEMKRSQAAYATGSAPTMRSVETDRKQPVFRRLLTLALLLVTTVIAVWVLVILPEDSEDSDPHSQVEPDAGAGVDTADAGPKMAASTERMSTPSLQIEHAPAPERSLLGFVIAPLALALIFWLWARFGGGYWLPIASRQQHSDDDQNHQQTGRSPPRRRSLETLILDEQDEEELIWGVGRFVSEERSRDLDIARSVRDTASAYGRPVLHYQGSEFQREVWLWIDESLDSPVARQLADDLALMLQKSGLPVVRATFWGIPERLRSERDEAITVDAFDARRDSAAVVILTDGRMLSLAHRARNRRGDIDNLLRNLSYWPHLTFIDFGTDRLTPLCQQHDLRVIKPQDAAGAISELAEAYERPIEYGALVGDARVWLAGCALAPRAISERTALSLRRELALNVSPWQIARIREHARDEAGRLGFSVGQRATHLAWLVQAEQVPTRGDRLPDTSLLRRIVEAWERVLDERARTLARATEKRGQVWSGCVEERTLAVERACIQLWAHPDRAAMRLYRLYHADEHGARALIRRHLAHLGGRERKDDDQLIALPWLLARMRRATRVMLHDMGLGSAGATPRRESMPAPGHIWLALGLCVGLIVGATVALIEQWTPPERPMPTFVSSTEESPENLPRNAFFRIDEENLIAEVAVPGMARVESEVKRGDKVSVRWHTDELSCSDEVGRALFVRCPRSAVALDRQNWSFAILSRESYRTATSIADELLRSGTVDGVYLLDSPAAIDDVPLDQLVRPEQRGARDQLLIVAPRAPRNIGDYQGEYVVISVDQLGLLSGITDDFLDWRTLARVQPRLDAIDGATDNFQVRGTGPCGEFGQRCCTAPKESCGDTLRCKDQTCVEPDCELPGSRCEGDVAITCTEDLTIEQHQCLPSEVCDDGTCLPRTCRQGELKCVARGTHYQSCADNGSAWSEAIRCPRGHMCTGAAGCEPIAGAEIQFLTVRHKQSKDDRITINYRLHCKADTSERSAGMNIELSTGDPVVRLRNKPWDRVPFDGRSEFFVECRTSGIRTSVHRQDGSITEARPIKLVRDMESNRHRWQPDLEQKVHQLILRNFGTWKTVTVEYRIKLLTGDAATRTNSPPGQDSRGVSAQSVETP